MCNLTSLYIEKKIDKYYSKYGIKRSLSGSIYLIEAIKLCVVDESLLRSVTTRLYPMIAKKYGVSSMQVERAIRNLINICYTNNVLHDTLLELVKAEPTAYNKYYKPSNSELISLCSWKLKIQLQEAGYLDD